MTEWEKNCHLSSRIFWAKIKWQLMGRMAGATVAFCLPEPKYVCFQINMREWTFFSYNFMCCMSMSSEIFAFYIAGWNRRFLDYFLAPPHSKWLHQPLNSWTFCALFITIIKIRNWRTKWPKKKKKSIDSIYNAKVPSLMNHLKL